MPRILPVLLPFVLFAVAACDNVGRAFDPVIGAPQPGTAESVIQVIPKDGDARRGVPQVRATFPQGGGWPLTVPIVVEFSESLNEQSVRPSSPTANDAKIVVRRKGTPISLPASYDFLAGGKLLVIRPAELTNAQNPTYEIVLLPGARDADGVPSATGENGEVLAEFQCNQDPSITNGRILTTFPRNGLRDGMRTTPYLVVFDRPPVLNTVTSANFRLRPQGGVPLAGSIEPAVQTAGLGDPRVLQFQPTGRLQATTNYELVVDDTILFPDGGRLDFQRRTPFASYRTVSVDSPVSVVVGNPLEGFPNKVNRSNFASLVLHVETPADTNAGDRVVARIYGGNATTTPLGDLTFLERTANAPVAGAQTVTVSFAGALGSLTRPRFDEGNISFAVQMQRGSDHSGYLLGDTAEQPLFDITRPRLLAAGPPAASSGNDVYTDQEALVYYGRASERLHAAELTDGIAEPVGMYASAADGRFACKPLQLGRLTAPRPYSLLLTDRAGNLAEAAIEGRILQRGSITGVFAGELTVEAFDLATLAPIANATVLVDIDTPTVPASNQVFATTDASGRASFSGLAGATRTVTIVRAGYHLATLYETEAAFVSLPLRPLQNATASFTGNVNFQPAAGATALVGNNALDDPQLLAVATTTAEATVIPATPILANRPQVITGFGGVFEPTGAPNYSAQGFQMLGPTLVAPAPPGAPAAGGASSSQNLTLLPPVTSPISNIVNVVGTAPKDFALAVGLDTGSLVGGRPIVRMLASLSGFGGQALAGIGHATTAGGAAYNVQATYGLPLAVGLADYAPLFWLCTEARDSAGRISRHRGLFLFGLLLDPTQPPAIPAVAVPAGSFVGSPLVEFTDVLDPAAVPGGVAIYDVVARDGNARLWQLWTTDGNAAGGSRTVQFPDLQTANVAGLASGNWTLRCEARLVYPTSGMSRHNLLLAERRRQEVLYARSTAVGHTVQ